MRIYAQCVCQSRDPNEEDYVANQLRKQLCAEIANYALKHNSIEMPPDAKMHAGQHYIRVEINCFSDEEIVNLLKKAYKEGQLGLPFTYI